MQQHQAAFSVDIIMAQMLCTSCNGWYAWLKCWQISSPWQMCPNSVLSRWHSFCAGKVAYGAPRLTLELCEAGHGRNRKTVVACLRRQELRAKAVRKFKATTNSPNNLPVVPNLQQQDFNATKPSEKYVDDIAYLWT